MTSILAKTNPPQQLEDHLLAVKSEITALLTPARLGAFLRLGIPSDEVIELCQSAAWLHDYGKATKEWQNAACSGRRLPQHSMTGFYAALLHYGEIDSLPWQHAAVCAAVLAHHHQLHDHSFARDNHSQKVTPLFTEWKRLNDICGWSIRAEIKPGSSLSESRLSGLVNEFKVYVRNRTREKDNSRFHALYCLILSLLVTADHQASAKHSGKAVLDFGLLTPPTNHYEATEFQLEVCKHPARHLCAIAACGAGKTSAALNRAAEYAEQQQIDRLIFCLPSRFTSNSILRDLTDPHQYGYDQSNVALIHGEALTVLRQRADDNQDSVEQFSITEEDALARWGIRYEHPITVSTIDHLLMSLYHGYKFSDRAYGNILSSLVVLDELHSYETTTMNAILDGLAILKQVGVPTLIMSATLPASRRNFFKISEDHIVKEQKIIFQPCIFKMFKTPLTLGKSHNIQVADEVNEFLTALGKRKIAVYVNQVERAKALANAAQKVLPHLRIFCYHSELAGVDRAKLEIEVVNAFRTNQPVVLVATQAAELSLDISADYMITELAPADVLVQRAGRLNRRATTPALSTGEDAVCWVAPTGDLFSEDTAHTLPYTDLSVLRRTWQSAPWDRVFNFKLAEEWCETALSEGIEPKQSGIRAAHDEDTVFGNQPIDNYNGEESSGNVVIRDNADYIYPVLPLCYYSCIRLHPEKYTVKDLAQFTIGLRRWRYYWLHKNGFIEENVVRLKNVEAFHVRCVMGVTYNAEKTGFDFSAVNVDTELEQHGGDGMFA